MQVKNRESEDNILWKGDYFMDILSKMPERLKELMFDRGVNAPKLAQTLTIGSNTITRYLRGEGAPSFEIFVKLVEYFNCSSDFLLGLEEQPEYEKKFLEVPPFSQQFRKAISECGISQYALQKKIGCSWNNFHKWLNGKSQPYPDSLAKLALAMDCSVDFLIGRVK